MRPVDCERRWEIDALRDGSLGARDAEAFERHARGCARCQAALARDAKLRELAAALPPTEPGELELRRLRARVLHDVATLEPSARRPPSVPLGVAFAAVIALAFFVWGVARRPSSMARAPIAAAPPAVDAAVNELASTISPSEGARWSRVREALTESVRLDDGTLWIHVRHQVQGERFLVLLPDGEIEVRGTTFEVTVRAGAAERVHVDEGTVALRLAVPKSEVALSSGQTWTAPRAATVSSESASAELAEASKEAVAKPRASATPRRLSPAPSAAASSNPRAAPNSQGDDESDAYVAAVALLQGAHYGAAASAFRAFGLDHPQAAQAEDASFLEAVALARAGRSDAAALAAENHLSRFPRSFHRKEAALLIARAARDRGDCDQARAVLAPWLGAPPDPEARASVETCLDRDR